MTRELSPQQKNGNGRYLLIFAACIAAFLLIENVLPKGTHTVLLVLLVFAAAAYTMYRMMKTNFSRCEFILTDSDFYITTAIGHKEHMDLVLPLKNVRRLYGRGDVFESDGVRVDTFGAEGGGYCAVLYFDERAKCDKLAKFSASEAFFQEFSEKLLDKQEES